MNRENVYVFDMDGTLYQIDGIDKGFSGSNLEANVLKNAKRFIQAKENCSDQMAENILNEGLADGIGISSVLASRYGISRTEYFDAVWNIAPDEIVQNYETAVDVIKQLDVDENILILLTSAPRIWQQIVMEFLGLSGTFDEIYTGDDFGTKKEIFEALAKKYLPSSVVSIGDQIKTDIEPAKEEGFQTLLVKSPNDLLWLLNETQGDSI